MSNKMRSGYKKMDITTGKKVDVPAWLDTKGHKMHHVDKAVVFPFLNKQQLPDSHLVEKMMTPEFSSEGFRDMIYSKDEFQNMTFIPQSPEASVSQVMELVDKSWFKKYNKNQEIYISEKFKYSMIS